MTELPPELPPEVEEKIRAMDPDEKVRAAIRAHLIRQAGVARGYVRLDDGSIVKEGESE